MNQARANSGQTPIGSLGPLIYPLIGTGSFRDITVGNNATPYSGGKYAATTGYDECSGIGVPLMQALTQQAIGAVTPSVPVQEITPGQNATFTVGGGTGSPTFQWQRKPIGSSTWSNLSDGGAYSGSATNSLTITAATLAMSGDQFQCVVTLSSSSATTAPLVLVVDRPLVVSTLAGQVGVTGITNGTGTAAQFNYPSAIAVDSTGNLFIADFSNNVIREITPGGLVSTPFGSTSGFSGSTNGTGNSALFNTPNAVAIDGSNNIYVADTGNNSVRKISGTTVSTLAGATNGFNSPEGIAVDVSGNVYLADTGTHTIRKITPGGAVSIFAGKLNVSGYLDGAATSQALFEQSQQYCGRQPGQCLCRRLWQLRGAQNFGRDGDDGRGKCRAGRATDGLGPNALFNAPIGLAVDDSDNLLIADCQVPPSGSSLAGNNVLRKLSTAGVVSTLAGSPLANGSTNGVAFRCDIL